MKITDSNILNIDKKLRDRYSTRYRSLGYSPKTLGWDTKNHQALRFASARRFLPNQLFSVCDVGCGFGDFYETFENKNSVDYLGVDINADLINEAKARYPNIKFIQKNILLDKEKSLLADWVVAFGVLNLKFTECSNIDFAKQLIAECFLRAGEGVVIDMLSSCFTKDYPPEDFVYYYSPEEMLAWALKLTPYATLVHDYAAIPQQEFMLVLKHNAWMPQ